MLHIVNVVRHHEIRENEYHRGDQNYRWYAATEYESDFIKRVQDKCNELGEENIVCIQFLKNDWELTNCVITYKDNT